jgi:hypothetical protein
MIPQCVLLGANFLRVAGWLVLAGIIGLFSFQSIAASDVTSDVLETGRLLAILLDAGRVSVGNNQSVINDPGKAQKGFTPEVFAAQTVALFKERTGHDLAHLDTAAVPAMAKPLLERLLEESKKTIDSYQPVIDIPGIKYKGLIPATFGTEAGKRFQNWSGVYLKQTAPEHLLRNPKNKPDEYEIAEMRKMSEASFVRDGERIVSATVDDGKAVRVMLPLFYGTACLSCHGTPKGERDISGYAREGGKQGDLGGAISVKLTVPD